jgi:hypothetical protein
MNDEELIQQFENGAIANQAFHHPDHVRLAFAYLSRFPVLQALDKFSSALRRFAAASGKSQLYHETITHAYFFVIRERMARCEGEAWEDFVSHNADLLVWKAGILNRYYQEETLNSEFARNVFVFPDKCI